MSESQAPATGVQPPLLSWTLSFLRPYRRRVWIIAILLLVQVGLGALEPWPLKIVIDNVLQGLPLADVLRRPVAAATGGSPFALLLLVVGGGVLLQVVHQIVSAYATQVQVDTGQRMVYDLRYRLFAHLQ